MLTFDKRFTSFWIDELNIQNGNGDRQYLFKYAMKQYYNEPKFCKI